MPIAYAVIRSGAALVRLGRTGAQGAALGSIMAQGVADAALGLGIVAFGEPRLADRLGGLLTVCVAYAVIYEVYAGLVRAAARLEDAPGEDLSAASLLGRPTLGMWEIFGVLPAILMAVIAVTARPGGGAFLFQRNGLDALTAAVAGVGVLVWVRRSPPASPSTRLLLWGLGVLLLLTALWVWW